MKLNYLSTHFAFSSSLLAIFYQHFPFTPSFHCKVSCHRQRVGNRSSHNPFIVFSLFVAVVIVAKCFLLLLLLLLRQCRSAALWFRWRNSAQQFNFVLQPMLGRCNVNCCCIIYCDTAQHKWQQ